MPPNPCNTKAIKPNKINRIGKPLNDFNIGETRILEMFIVSSIEIPINPNNEHNAVMNANSND